MTKKIANFFLLLFFFMGFSGYAMPTDEEWDKYVELFHKRLFHQRLAKETNNNNQKFSEIDSTQKRDIVRLFARAVHEGFYQANYAGLQKVQIPLSNGNFGNPIIEFRRGHNIGEDKAALQSLHTHFKAELENFDLNSIEVCIPYSIIESYDPYYVKS